MKLSRRVQVALTAVATVGVLAACNANQAGAAVTYEGGRITENVVAEQNAQLAAALQIAESPRITQFTVQRLVTNLLIEQGAVMKGVTVSDGETQKFLTDAADTVGGMDALVASAVQQGIPASELPVQVRTRVLADQLGEALAPGEDLDTKDVAVGRYLVEVSQTINVDVNPRFGSWQADRLTVAPPPDDLSIPAPVDELMLPGQLTIPSQ